MTERLSSQFLGRCKRERLYWSPQKCLSLRPCFPKLETGISEYKHKSIPTRCLGTRILFMQRAASDWPNHLPNQGCQGWPDQVVQGGCEIPAMVISDVQLSWNKPLRCRNECWTYHALTKTRQWVKMLIKKSGNGIGEAWRHQSLTDATVSLGHAPDADSSCLYFAAITESKSLIWIYSFVIKKVRYSSSMQS